MGGNLAEIRPLLTLPQNSESSKMGIFRSGDSGKYFLRSDDSAEYFSENTRKVVKLEKRKSLVIAVGGNLAEIRTLLALPRKIAKVPKWGSSEVVILENTFRKMLVKSQNWKGGNPRNCIGWKYGKNPPTTSDPSQIAKVQKMGIARSGDSGKYFSENTRNVVKLETWESLVIVVVGKSGHY